MPENLLNPLSKFLEELSEQERELLTFALGQQVESMRKQSDAERRDALEARVTRDAQ